MTFQSEEVRHTYHGLSTALQHELETLDRQFARRGIFLHVEEVTTDSEIVIRINKQFISRLSANDLE